MANRPCWIGASLHSFFLPITPFNSLLPKPCWVNTWRSQQIDDAKSWVIFMHSYCSTTKYGCSAIKDKQVPSVWLSKNQLFFNNYRQNFLWNFIISLDQCFTLRRSHMMKLSINSFSLYFHNYWCFFCEGTMGLPCSSKCNMNYDYKVLKNMIDRHPKDKIYYRWNHA